jgi:uncharacterized membrane protein
LPGASVRRLSWFILLTSFSAGGLIASSIVLYMWYILGRMPPGCYLPQAILPGVTIDCITVLSSPYSHVGPIPLDALAAIWFIINIILVILFFNLSNMNIIRILYYWRILGLLVLPYLLFVEFVVLKALCIYCTIMHGFIIADFVIISIFIKRITGKI